MDGRLVGWCEQLLQSQDWFTDDVAARAAALRRTVLAHRLGGRWWGKVPQLVAGRSVVFASPDRETTRRMLQDALSATDAGRITLVVDRPGALGREARRRGVAVLCEPVDPWPLLEAAGRLYAPADSDAALAAGLLGKPVTIAGPGPLALTTDPDRLAAAALLLGARYADPFTGAPSTPENYLDRLADMRRHQRTRVGVACCVGISFWKRRRVAAMLGGDRPPAFCRSAAAAVAAAAGRDGGIAVWASRMPAGLAEAAERAGVPLFRMEDGFVRSVGLGADFLPPLSLVLDRTGLYYDATGPSDLETLLAETCFDPALLCRAAALRQRLVADKVTKYNLPAGVPFERPRGRRVILVPGQVADDRSVLLGGAGLAPGLDLLRRVRRHAPDAFILYKPHPDVDAGHRAGAVPDRDVLAIADQVLRGGSMADLLGRVDEVHTLTSLTGFEALLRGTPVTTYGQPFYAGWGLTTDLAPPARRLRCLQLDELVAAAMILYPTYLDPVTGLACGPEIVMDRLRDPALHRAGWLVRARRAQGRWAHRWRALAPPSPSRDPSWSRVA